MFTFDELSVIDCVLEKGIEDMEHYLKHGDVERDFSGDEEGLARIKALSDSYLGLRRKILKLQNEDLR
jgi:hypothetical protein